VIDLVVERRDGRILAIEVKLTVSPGVSKAAAEAAEGAPVRGAEAGGSLARWVSRPQPRIN
jgi:hypothetical protein